MKQVESFLDEEFRQTREPRELRESYAQSVVLTHKGLDISVESLIIIESVQPKLISPLITAGRR